MSIAAQLRVLIVDDTSTSRMLIRDGLEELGVRNIFFAGDGEQALQFMMATPAHLVISDFNMPKLDGLGLLKAIRNYNPTKKVPFIMLTGRADKTLLENAVKLGVNNFLTKPFTVPALKKALEAIIGKLA
ncbi:response regulator [Methylosinus sp. H3A]|jgi:two-component system, chemotaxis family, chemotaxis protein CheY|uniref:response regulator n=1 Tax=Methylosinus sp. H3A TaxID=2785786 RepID=UPI0018C2DBFC|nr:response regulator [Methylosinus sp. H3A]MBG0808632.1 response regulator [Methylosinus sp. H3A]